MTSENEEDENTNQPIDDDIETPCQSTQRKRARQNWIKPRLVAALDAAKVTDCQATHILAAAADSFGVSTENLVLNRTSIRRQELRRNELDNIQTDFTESVI